MLQYQLKTEDAPVLRLLDSIITRGLEKSASDIHLEPGDRFCRIRYRIDGVLQQEQTDIPAERHGALVSCLKLMGGMDIAEKRAPQDGRAQITWKGRGIDLRMSSLPTISGESVVLRILDSKAGRMTLQDMGFSRETLFHYRNMYRTPYGLILLTGPTGSGKTTTLYATLQELNRPDRNIVTIEDPVEFRFEGLNQVAVNTKAGMTFAGGLRAILRQDPNIIMIGEIRDRETAAICIQAALTGHLVFSTLHTNTAAGAVSRLTEMGIEPFLLASALRGVVAQRLMRKLCPNCKRACTEGEAGRAGMFPATGGKPEPVLYQANGCENCFRSGYRGRIPVLELFPVNSAIKEKIAGKASEAELAAAVKAQFPELLTLREAGIRMTEEGLTSVQEFLRVMGV